MILDWSETAPTKAKAVTSVLIEQVDANALKVVAAFPSQSEAERQTDSLRRNIRRGLRRGRLLGGYFWRSVHYSKPEYPLFGKLLCTVLVILI
jgi:hypothetical protein